MPINLDDMPSFAEKRTALKKFLAKAEKPGAICWALHALIDTWQTAVKAEAPEAITLEELLANHRYKFQKTHNIRLRNEGLAIRSFKDPDFLIELGAIVIKDDGRQVILRRTEDSPPETHYRRMSAEELSAKVAERQRRSQESRAERNADCQARRGDAAGSKKKAA